MAAHANERRSDVELFPDFNVDGMAQRAIEELARRMGRLNDPVDPAQFDEIAIERLFAAATGNDPLSCSAVARDLLSEGVPAERICDHYIPDVARRMGDGWTDDTMSFSSVTIGTARLQFLLREIGAEAEDDRRWNAEADQSQLLLVLAQHADHTLGLMVMAGQLRRRGFLVRMSLGDSAEAVIETIRHTAFDAIFLSVSVADGVRAAADVIATMRASLPDLPPLVLGGAALTAGGLDVASLTGADLVTSDIDAALRHCGLKGRNSAIN